MSEYITIRKQNSIINSEIPLAASKSESNRALIIQALTKGDSFLSNLSSARDTQIMQDLLASNDDNLNVKDAGTVMRFVTAYLALNATDRTITGTERMLQRPIGMLVDALNGIGADIKCSNKKGYPPLLINKITEQKTNHISIAGNVSSQYISALMMIAPALPEGLNIEIEGTIYSLPYINMTLGLMAHFGIEFNFENQIISISPQPYKSNNYTIESDWSGASYWYSFVALSGNTELKLLGLKKNSLQGDQAIVDIMKEMGVDSAFEEDGVRIKKGKHCDRLKYDFKKCPDLAQTVMALAAAKKIELEMTGLESLKIKETDRTLAMSKELAKVGAVLKEKTDGSWELTFDGHFEVNEPIQFETYDDHRMAMALAPLCLRFDVTMNNPNVVRKSYPEFWEHLENVGITTKRSQGNSDSK